MPVYFLEVQFYPLPAVYAGLLAKVYTHLSREEIQTMLQIHDIRGSRVYQEAKDEGRKEVIAIARLAAEKKSDVEIAASLGMDVDLVRQVLAQIDRE